MKSGQCKSSWFIDTPYNLFFLQNQKTCTDFLAQVHSLKVLKNPCILATKVQSFKNLCKRVLRFCFTLRCNNNSSKSAFEVNFKIVIQFVCCLLICLFLLQQTKSFLGISLYIFRQMQMERKLIKYSDKYFNLIKMLKHVLEY